MRALVVGGGVAGMVSALSLHRIGARVEVVEAHADPGGEVGSFLSLAVNGLRALAAVDCLDRVRARGFEVSRQRLWSGGGALLGDVARGRREADPLRSVTLMRAHLVDELRRAAAEAGIVIHTGSPLVALEPLPRLADGRTVEADLVVGADGIWSTTRTLLDPGAPRPTYAGLYVVSGRSRGVAVEPGTFHLTFARAGAFLHLPDPTGDVWWQAQVRAAVAPDPATAANPARLARLFVPEAVPAALLAATTVRYPPTLMHRLAPVPVPHTDRVVLIGDAAHPLGAGQGASMAIEDAVVLAAAVAGAPDVATGLARYRVARHDRVRRMAAVSDDTSDIKKSGPVGRALRRVVMPVVLPRVFERATGWLYDLDLPELAPATRR